jgi:DNA-binding transcriptional ArsR family regulator
MMYATTYYHFVMDETPRLLEVIQALADPLRLAVLHHLMGGPASVSELMAAIGTEQSRLSNHLAVLRNRGLVRATRQGRQIIYEIRDAAVGRLVESLAQVGGAPPRTTKSAPIAHARTCYDHAAGRLGVAVFKALVERRALKPQTGVPGDVELGPEAARCFRKFNVDLDTVRQERRRFATACLDWTERQAHLGGALGAALWDELVVRGWVARRPGSRAVVITRAGARGLKRTLGVVLE